MSKKTGAQAISPSAEMSQKGDYPVTVPIFLFWDETNPDKRIEQFALFCKNRLQDAVGQIPK
jgi:ABC-type phosphate transport system substrate-binding protein